MHALNAVDSELELIMMIMTHANQMIILSILCNYFVIVVHKTLIDLNFEEQFKNIKFINQQVGFTVEHCAISVKQVESLSNAGNDGNQQISAERLMCNAMNE
ncbi:hypothetical protein T4B_10380 [Trichinella pseudospiralis]|uniref:Uncharacterized protein n=1 Tax=Trichinella pseudospiralis TaxID=6337 RepID=A0A0V0Y3I0_TRIPS|nr:hypothetical protein T4E_1206 [Trichinella pseudospiralis]KRZ24043.1 hypothetical protein T4B_10380 [Trichinella pseudospiralis]